MDTIRDVLIVELTPLKVAISNLIKVAMTIA